MRTYKRGKLNKECATCKNEFSVFQCNKRLKYCSSDCYWKTLIGKKLTLGKHFKLSQGTKDKMSLARRGHITTQSTREKISKANAGKKRTAPMWNKGMKFPERSGEKHHNWKGGIQYRPYVHLTGNAEYKNWRRSIFERDGWKCKMLGDSCEGGLQAHHILNWIDYPELRYNINNGITLCHAHHPRGRVKEKRMVPTFVELLSVSKDGLLM